MDRLGQIAPKMLVACDGYTYNARRFSSVERVHQVPPRSTASSTS